MRIPLAKVYRAFPELDRFPDHECERFVKRARRTQLRWMWLPVLALPVSLALAIASVALVASTLEAQIRAINHAADRVLGGAFEAVLGSSVYPSDILMPLCVLLLISLGPWLTFAVLRDTLLRRAIARRLEIANCTGCDHSLLGLPLLEDHPKPAVRCPECGREMVLAEIGLTPEDLIARCDDATAGPDRFAEEERGFSSGAPRAAADRSR
jgi:hypothetical protein